MDLCVHIWNMDSLSIYGKNMELWTRITPEAVSMLFCLYTLNFAVFCEKLQIQSKTPNSRVDGNLGVQLNPKCSSINSLEKKMSRRITLPHTFHRASIFKEANQRGKRNIDFRIFITAG